jgi:hypothetical protein
MMELNLVLYDKEYECGWYASERELAPDWFEGMERIVMRLHRGDDKPAVTSSRNMGKEWYKNGYLHREYGRPAVISGRSIRFWYINGQAQKTSSIHRV